MPVIEYLESTVVYENPLPHVRSRHGYFPGLAALSSGELLALFMIAEAFEAANGTTFVSRSADGGRSWRLQGPLHAKPALGFETTDAMKATVLRDGTLAAIGYRFHRRDPESPIAIPETGGILPGDDIFSTSNDGGATWTEPAVIDRGYPELLEISGPCIELPDGELLAVAALYPMPDGSLPSGHRGVVARSADRGRTWDTSVTFFRHSSRPVAPYEPRVARLDDGRLIALVWAYDTGAGAHLNNHAAISPDEGRTWGEPIDTGHRGQASSLMPLGGDLLLSIHAQRGEDPGIWVRAIDVAAGRWNMLAETEIYGAFHGRQTSAGQSAANMFKSLRFGQPSLLRLDEETVLASHWCVEEGQGKIRTHRLRVRA